MNAKYKYILYSNNQMYSAGRGNRNFRQTAAAAAVVKSIFVSVGELSQ